MDAYSTGLSGERDERGHRLVVRNGHAVPRTITTAAGPVEVTAPRVNDKRVDEAGERQQFRSSILTPWARKSPKVSEVLPLITAQPTTSSVSATRWPVAAQVATRRPESTGTGLPARGR